VSLLARGKPRRPAGAEGYAYCVELGVPGLKQRPVAELAKLLREVRLSTGPAIRF